MTDHWFDEAAGPVVRPYAMTRGRTRGAADEQLDLIALVIADRASGAEGVEAVMQDSSLAPEHVEIVTCCRITPQSVADLATALDVPVGVVRVLIGDLLDAELVRVSRPVPPAELPDERVLRDVINGLRAL